ncbi:MAG TPA: helix-turn-helix transcriptional regulator [Pyrinomonadaceae bacterium]|nr:helix-turn-helix transcriptional regulator [Pyrinomonadaceae bacterium]
MRKERAVGQRGRKKPKRLGEKLLAIRFKLEVSQSQLAKLLEFDKGVARISEYERGNREPDLMTLLKYSELARVSVNVLADDSRELKFPESWKRPKQVTELLERQRRGRIQNRIDILRRQLSRSL